VVTEVARSLEFSPAILEMADRVVAAISKSATSFNAVHLRIEKDARDWSQIMGGPEVSGPSPLDPQRGFIAGHCWEPNA